LHTPASKTKGTIPINQQKHSSCSPIKTLPEVTTFAAKNPYNCKKPTAATAAKIQ